MIAMSSVLHVKVVQLVKVTHSFISRSGGKSREFYLAGEGQI